MTQFKSRHKEEIRFDGDAIDLSHLSSSDDDVMPALVTTDPMAALYKWDTDFGSKELARLMNIIESDESNSILDPGWCTPNCEYSTGNLAAQRYALLKRLYQIHTVLSRRQQKTSE